MNRRQGGSGDERVHTGPLPPSGRAGEGGSDAAREEIAFVIRPSQVLKVQLVVIVLLVAISTVGQALVHYLPDFWLRDTGADLVFVGSEQNLPTLYSVLTLLACALLLAMIAHAHHRGDRGYVRHWAALSLMSSYLALDEFVSLHERADAALQKLLGTGGEAPWYAWAVAAAIGVTILIFVFRRFLQHLPQRTRQGLLTGGALYLGGAVGVELVASWYDSRGDVDMAFVLIRTAADALEMLGVAVVVYTLLSYISAYLPNVTWKIRVVPPD